MDKVRGRTSGISWVCIWASSPFSKWGCQQFYIAGWPWYNIDWGDCVFVCLLSQYLWSVRWTHRLSEPLSVCSSRCRYGERCIDFMPGTCSTYQSQFAWTSKRLELEYKEAMNAYIKGKKDDGMTMPTEPPMRMLVIPANSSASSFLKILGDNDGIGLLFESEGDTLSQTWSRTMVIIQMYYERHFTMS